MHNPKLLDNNEHSPNGFDTKEDLKYNLPEISHESDCKHNDNSLICHRLNRLSDVMVKYRDDEPIHFNISMILDDFLHLMEHHDDDKQFQVIIHQFGGFCDQQNCKIFQRHWRNRDDLREQNKKQNILYQENAIQNVVYQRILDRIHCHYSHFYDPFHPNNNVSEVDDKKVMIIEGNHPYKNMKQQNIQNIQIRKIRYNQISVESKEPEKAQNSNERMYSFGYKFIYDDKDNDDDKNEDNYAGNMNSGIYVFAKYSSLKEELTMNQVSIISIKQFDKEYNKAQIYLNSDFKKKYYFEISIQHLLSLMIYCNFTSLQYEFSKTYRIDNGNKHDNFYHFGKYLKYAIHKFGTSMDKGKITSFYHGIGEKLLFSQYNGNGYGFLGVQINCPLSTSSSFEVAANFTNNNQGLIVEFGGNVFGCNNTKYFPVSWLSDYGNESECLFIQNQYRLQINNIVDTKLQCTYHSILNAINILYDIIAGYDIDEHQISDSQKILINKLICNELSYKYPNEYDSFNSLNKYEKILFHTFCENRKWITINLLQLKRHSFLINIFYDEIGEQIKFREITTLFPYLEIININNTNITQQLVNDIIFYLNNQLKLNRIEIMVDRNTNNTDLSILSSSTSSSTSSIISSLRFCNKSIFVIFSDDLANTKQIIENIIYSHIIIHIYIVVVIHILATISYLI